MSRVLCDGRGEIGVISDMTIHPQGEQTTFGTQGRGVKKPLLAFSSAFEVCAGCRVDLKFDCTNCRVIGKHVPLNYAVEKRGARPDEIVCPMKGTVDHRVHADGTPRPLREEQKLPFVKIVSHLRNNVGIHVNLRTGFGKTEIAIKTALFMGMKAIVLVTKAVLREQWKASIAKYGPTASEMFHVVLPKSFKHPPNAADFELLIVDEMHEHCTVSSVRAILSMSKIKRVMALTATPGFAATNFWGFARALVGESCVTVKTDKSYKVCVRTIDLVVENVKSLVTTKGKPEMAVNFCKTMKNVVFDSTYVREVLQTVIDEIALGHKIILLCEFAKQVEMLAEGADLLEIDNSLFYKSMTSYRDARLLIGTVDKMGTGFDEVAATKGMCTTTSNVLIICSSFKKRSTLQQTVGRVFRNDEPKIIQFLVENPILGRHIDENRKFFMEYGSVDFENLPVRKTFDERIAMPVVDELVNRHSESVSDIDEVDFLPFGGTL